MTQTPLFIPENITHKQRWGQLYGSSLPLALAEYCRQTAGIKLLVTPDNLSAQHLHAELVFFLADESQELLLFPDWETLPYDQFSPHQDIISERLYTLSRLQQTTHAIVIVAVSTLMHRLCPSTFLNQHVLTLSTKQTLDIDQFRHKLQQSGYYCVNTVLEHGEFAVRGSMIDLYPMGSEMPFRIELFDDEIDSLRTFDPDTQRTIDKIQSINILPAREFPLNPDSISLFRRTFRNEFSGNPSHCPLYEAVTNSQFPNGIEYYLPLFFDYVGTFFDYLPSEANICLVESTTEDAEQFWQELCIRFEQRRHDVSRPILSPDRLFLSPTDLFTQLNAFHQLKLTQRPLTTNKHGYAFHVEQPPDLPVDRHSEQPLSRVATYMQEQGWRYLIIADSRGRQEMLSDLLRQSGVTPKVQTSWKSFISDDAAINILVAPLSTGAVLMDMRISILVESQFFGEHSVKQRRISQTKSVNPELIVRDLAELRIGAPVVHFDYGVGRYIGLQTLTHENQVNEFLVLAYAGEDKIYVPVTSLHLISRYTGADSEHAPLHRLGSDHWQKEKRKAQEKIHDVAAELLEIYAKREASTGFRYTLHETDYQRFASGFLFEETLDQSLAIKNILQDMASSKPMDRLICGDVGFGKTEVAMRAAFMAVQNGKQVCVLAPTTLLAGQHFETFRDRFADFAVNIDLLSRFKTSKESAQVVRALEEGRIDIVIGTHKLFQQQIKFSHLGLLIIDEEHRFGVKQKEHLKALRAEVDVLCMTATPIPRTLNMAMAGIRDVSLIATPPAKRLAIKTFWQERQDMVLREAILREILRGGQVFFLHNNVQTIDRVCHDIQTLVPEAQVRIAHGQMRERDLERMMSDFYHHRFNVLVCTTIIETGIDIPTANTIIIDRADKFGLAQLHQLRGRVGRSHHQAYAYLLTPNKKLLTADAIKRLEAIVSLEDLGAGFTLATLDLEIRGAGELLGEGQSGHMHAIGFNLYMEMLDQAVHDLKSGKIAALDTPIHHGADIDLGISAIIPDDYIHDVHTRLIFYKRIASTSDKHELRDMQIELIDRFGLLPASVKRLFLITNLKILAKKLGILRIRASQAKGKIEFTDEPLIDPGCLIQLIQVHHTQYQLDGPKKLRFTLQTQQHDERIHEIASLLLKLAPEAVQKENIWNF